MPPVKLKAISTMISTRLSCHTIARTNRFAVLQTTIYYNNDSIGGIQTTEVAGTYPTRKAARAAAKNTLLNEEVTKEWFAEYDEKDSERDEWPYGDDVLIHAVAETGENFKISVKAQPHSHQHHERKHQGKKSDLSQNEE
jgi:hypothetical protein